MKNLIGIAIAIALAISLLLAFGVHVFGPISGGACAPIGDTRNDLARNVWVCVKNDQTGNGFWAKVTP